MIKLLKQLYKKSKYYFLDNYEKEFINKSNQIKLSKVEGSILIQCTQDYFYVRLYSLVIQNEKNNCNKVFGLLTIPLIINLKDVIFFFPFLAKCVMHILSVRKWKKIYKSIGVTNFIISPELVLPFNIKKLIKAFKIYMSLKSKRDIIEIEYNGIKCGDLIYDTCVRFNFKKPYVDLNDFYLFCQIFKCINYVDYINLSLKKIKPSNVFFTMAVYIQHGIPCRVFINHGIPVYTSGNFEKMFKLLSKENYLMAENFSFYKTDFKKKFGKKESEEGLKVFRDRFDGIDTSGFFSSLGVHPYNSNQIIDYNYRLDGVLFLHNLFDAHKIYGKVIFNDFYEWTIYTLDLIKNNNLNIGIKPHPHQIPDSAKFIEIIKNDYKDLKWIDSDISNIEIFKSGIKFGISHHGTVLSELADFGIVPICCAPNPTSSFDFTYQAKSILEYKNLIINHHKLHPKNLNQVGSFYYMHHINKKSDYLLRSNLINGINLKNVNRFSQSSMDLLT